MLIKIKVKTGDRAESVSKVSDDAYEIALREEAENNSANSRLLEILHGLYAKAAIKIVKGHHSPHKIISVDNM